MKKIHNFKNGDRVTMLTDFSPSHKDRFEKGDTGVVINSTFDCWEIEVKIDKNKEEYGVTEKCIALLEKTPIDIKHHITIGEHEFLLYPDEMYVLYCKLKKVKKQFTFQGKKVKLNKKQFEIVLTLVKKIVVKDFYYYE